MILSKEEVWVLRGINFRLAFTEESVDATGPNRRRIPLRHRFSDSDGLSGRERERVEEKIARGLVSLHGDSQVIEVNRFSLLLRRNYGRFLGEEAEEELGGVSDEVKSFRVDFVDVLVDFHYLLHSCDWKLRSCRLFFFRHGIDFFFFLRELTKIV